MFIEWIWLHQQQIDKSTGSILKAFFHENEKPNPYASQPHHPNGKNKEGRRWNDGASGFIKIAAHRHTTDQIMMMLKIVHGFYSFLLYIDIKACMKIATL